MYEIPDCSLICFSVFVQIRNTTSYLFQQILVLTEGVAAAQLVSSCTRT